MTEQLEESNKIHRTEDMALNLGAKTLHEGRRSSYNEIDRYIGQFIDAGTGLLKAGLLEYRDCPVCGADDSIQMFIKRGGTYVKCARCGMCYLNPVFRDNELKSYYQGLHCVMADTVQSESEFSRRMYNKGLELIANWQTSGQLLDIGCSAGFFMDVAQERGWQTQGIELNRSEAAQARDKGHQVENVPIGETSFNVRFNAITLWDVFEHIKDGASYLGGLKNHLADDGVVFLQIPNSEALAPRIMHEKCNMFDGVEHVNLYTPDTIRTVAEKSGYRIHELQTVISEIPVINNYLSYEHPYFGNATHRSTLLGVIDEQFIHANLLGYKMQLVLRPL